MEWMLSVTQGSLLMSRGSVWSAAEMLDTYPLLPLQTSQPKSSLSQIPAFPSRDIAQGLSHQAHNQSTNPGTGWIQVGLTHAGDKGDHTNRRPVQRVPQVELHWMSSGNFFKLVSHQDILSVLKKRGSMSRLLRASYLFPALSVGPHIPVPVIQYWLECYQDSGATSSAEAPAQQTPSGGGSGG